MIPIKDPGDSAWYQIDWTNQLGASTLASVAHTVPSGITLVDESTDTDAGTSSFRISGGTHGQTYIVEGVATLSTGETLNRNLPITVFNG